MATTVLNMSETKMTRLQRPRIGVSSCLMGQRVRYDGGHKKNPFISGPLANKFEIVPICPEVAIGMSIPREPIRLVNTGEGIRARGLREPRMDVTDRLQHFAGNMVPLLKTLSGYVFKKDSPSCGVFRVKIYDEDGIPVRRGQGIFAHEVIRGHPYMPIEEEGRLNDATLRTNFLKRVLIYHDWQMWMQNGLTARSLQDFHRIHKFTLLAHDQKRYRKLGRFVAGCRQCDIEPAANYYITEFMRALCRIPTPSQHVNVMMHVMGFLKHGLHSGSKAELLLAIHKYRVGEISRDVPMTLIGHHLKSHPNEYLSGQHYLKCALPL